MIAPVIFQGIVLPSVAVPNQGKCAQTFANENTDSLMEMRREEGDDNDESF